MEHARFGFCGLGVAFRVIILTAMSRDSPIFPVSWKYISRQLTNGCDTGISHHLTSDAYFMWYELRVLILFFFLCFFLAL